MLCLLRLGMCTPMPSACPAVHCPLHVRVHACTLPGLDMRPVSGLEHPWFMLANPAVEMAVLPALVLCQLQCGL